MIESIQFESGWFYYSCSYYYNMSWLSISAGNYVTNTVWFFSSNSLKHSNKFFRIKDERKFFVHHILITVLNCYWLIQQDSLICHGYHIFLSQKLGKAFTLENVEAFWEEGHCFSCWQMYAQSLMQWLGHSRPSINAYLIDESASVGLVSLLCIFSIALIQILKLQYNLAH